MMRITQQFYAKFLDSAYISRHSKDNDPDANDKKDSTIDSSLCSETIEAGDNYQHQNLINKIYNVEKHSKAATNTIDEHNSKNIDAVDNDKQININELVTDDWKRSTIDSIQTDDIYAETIDSSDNVHHPKPIDKISNDEKHSTTGHKTHLHNL